MIILKFGGKSLEFPNSIENVVNIIQRSPLDSVVVVSAIGNTTDILEQLLNKAKVGDDYSSDLQTFFSLPQHQVVQLEEQFILLEKSLEGVHLLGDYSPKIKDNILAIGELISAKVLTQLLIEDGISAQFVDSRVFLKTDSNYGNAQPLLEHSQTLTRAYFSKIKSYGIPIVTGYIASDKNGNTTTLGRNGSNYSAALLANFLHADEFQNFTHVDGIFTADPNWVTDAQLIDRLHYTEASELASFGANILHAKTILPLVEKEIPLRILNTNKPLGGGTLISANPTSLGIKSLAVQSNVSLLKFEGKGLLGITGIDARIFRALADKNINVGLISQGSSERGVGLVIKSTDAETALAALESTFEKEIVNGDVERIDVNENIAVISIIGQDLNTFDRSFSALVKNKVSPLLFSNSISGSQVSLVITKPQLKRALNVIHGQIFGISKRINLAILGHGTVGSVLIDQIIENVKTLEDKKNIKFNIFAIANSKKVVLDRKGIESDWRANIHVKALPYKVEDILQYASEYNLENLILIDNTSSDEVTNQYFKFIENGFDIISSNKTANTKSYHFYKSLRKLLKDNQKEYLYETNVGAGLPLIDTIRLLHLSGENITKIRGVFSGTLSYIFNRYSVENVPFSEILLDAIQLGFTEPDPRLDLSGEDVARKLLILARELELENEWLDIKIESLIPVELKSITKEKFLANLSELDNLFAKKKANLKPNEVLRYTGELSGNLQEIKGNLETSLIIVQKDTALGALKGSDSIFEIYTESYGENPIVIQGAGAGAKVTARGVFGDVLRLAERK